MPRCCQNYIILESRRRQIDLLIFICLSALDLWLFKKNACQYLYFQILLYISQNADMSAKWCHFGIKMSSDWFFNVTYVYQIWICDNLKRNACKYFILNVTIYKPKWQHVGKMTSLWHLDVGVSIWNYYFPITFLF